MKPTKPALWEAAKKRARAASEGSKPGRWGVRKAALARLDYKRRGGEWREGPKPPQDAGTNAGTRRRAKEG